MTEPIAFFDPQEKGFYWAKPTKITAPTIVDVEPLPLYTQRTWVGLTDKEMLECLKAVDVVTAVSLLMSQYEMPPTFKVYAEAIEAKLKEKNYG
jgi:hypothetical protein